MLGINLLQRQKMIKVGAKTFTKLLSVAAVSSLLFTACQGVHRSTYQESTMMKEKERVGENDEASCGCKKKHHQCQKGDCPRCNKGQGDEGSCDSCGGNS